MKKILLLFLLFYGQIFALDKESTLKFYHHIFEGLLGEKTVSVYVKDKKYADVFSHSRYIKLAESSQNADIILLTNKNILKKILKNKNNNQSEGSQAILFATDYRLLKYSEDIVGAFYWKKGRSQLLFVKNRLDKQDITLPSEYKKYTVDKL